MSAQFYELVAYLINIVDKSFVVQTLGLFSVTKLNQFYTFLQNNQATIVGLYDQRRYNILFEIVKITLFGQ